MSARGHASAVAFTVVSSASAHSVKPSVSSASESSSEPRRARERQRLRQDPACLAVAHAAARQESPSPSTTGRRRTHRSAPELAGGAAPTFFVTPGATHTPSCFVESSRTTFEDHRSPTPALPWDTARHLALGHRAARALDDGVHVKPSAALRQSSPHQHAVAQLGCSSRGIRHQGNVAPGSRRSSDRAARRSAGTSFSSRRRCDRGNLAALRGPTPAGNSPSRASRSGLLSSDPHARTSSGACRTSRRRTGTTRATGGDSCSGPEASCSLEVRSARGCARPGRRHSR